MEKVTKIYFYKIVVFKILILHMQCMQAEMVNIDPIVDLRTPRSLFELLHDDMNDISVALDSNLIQIDLSLLQSVQDTFVHLLDSYDSMINTTRNHQVHRGDKEFLQKMIDRIDKLIAELEDKSEDEQNQDAQEAVRSIKNLSESLHAKIS